MLEIVFRGTVMYFALYAMLRRRNIRRALITEEKLRGLLRKQGIADLTRLSEVRMRPMAT